MRELVRTNDIVLVSAIGALLDGADIPHLVFDQNMSVMEGSVGMLPRRILVADDLELEARALLHDAGLGHELRPSSTAPATTPETTNDAVLGGRLRLRQPKKGHRVGHDAILLAAATEAEVGEHVVDLGAGVGSAGLALAIRVPGLRVTLVEIDPQLCSLARENASANGLADRVSVLALDVTTSGAFDAAGLNPGCAQRVLMNPPFNDAERLIASPNESRRLAHSAPRETLPSWVNTAVRLLADGGVLTLIWRAEGMPDVLAALDGDFGDVNVMPVLPRAGAKAIRVIMRARKGGGEPLRLSPELVLNDADGKPTAEAEAVLRAGQPLRFAEN